MDIPQESGMIQQLSALGRRPIPLRKGQHVNALKALTVITFVEATSWIGLLIGMIFKYGFDNERGVSLMGPIHGMLFIAFVVLLLATHVQEHWPIRKTFIAFLESIPPITGFFLGKRLLEEVRQQESTSLKSA
jgi:integral membrane protein